MTESKIITLADLNNNEDKPKRSRIVKKTKVESAKKLIASTKFKKSDEWLGNINHFKQLSNSLEQPDDLLLVPIKVDNKMPDIGSKKWSRNKDAGNTKKQLWCWDDWEKIDHDHTDTDLGMLIRGEVGVLDWDTQESYNWFMTEFIKDSKDFNIYTSNEKHSGGHIIFRITEETKSIFDKITNQRRWLSKPTDLGATWDVDLKKEAKTTSPVVVKLPSMLERSKKVWVNQSPVINPLPQSFVSYLSEHIYTNPKHIINKSNKHFIIELLKLLPKDVKHQAFKQGEFNRVIMECLKQGISQAEFYDWSSKLDISKEYGEGHRQFIRNAWSYALSNTETCGRGIDNTLNLVKRVNGTEFDSFVSAYIHSCKTCVFERQFVRLIDWFYRDDTGTKTLKVMRYCNKFFTFTTGMMKNLTYYKEYDLQDNLTSVKYYQDIASFDSATDVKITYTAEGDKIPVGKYWRSQADNSYHKVINRPYGIKERIFSSDLNTFTGYKMKYEQDYKGDEYTDMLGNRIDQHFSKIVCAGDEDSINWMRKYFYDMIFLGKRPKVAIFCCSVAMGSGKSMFISPFAKWVIGENQSRVIQNFAKMCKDTFTDYYDDASFVILEEIPKYDQAKYSEMYEEFKELITGDRQSSRKFQQAPTQIENNSSWWVNSNHPQGLQPEIADRRFMCLEVSPERVGDIKYFEELGEAVNNPDAWTNWFHKHIIQREEEFRHMICEPIKKHIPMTNLKQRILTRRIDNFTLFFKYAIYETHWYDERKNDPHEFVRGKKIQIKLLFEMYELWKQTNDIGQDWCNDLVKFSKKLNQHFYMEEENLTTISIAQMKDMKKKQKVYLKPERNSQGKYITITDEFLTLLDSLIQQCGPLDKQQYVSVDDVLDFDQMPIELKEQQLQSENDEYNKHSNNNW